MLEIKSLDEQHNHETNKELFRNLWQQRKLGDEEKENIRQMLDMKANKKIIQSNIMQATGKVVLMKDIHNMKVTNNKQNDLTTLQKAVNELTKVNGAFVKLQTDNKMENPELTGLFYQDERMRQVFAEYPEFLCVDATYKVNDLRMPLYLIIVENGNGQSEIVGVWVVANESEETIQAMVDIFKEQNPKWTDVKTVMTDKDFVEREVFSNSFPDAKLRICLFHVLRTFRREITAEKMGVTKLQRDSLLDTFQKLTYSRNLNEYESNKKLLLDKNISAAESYFMNSWDNIKEQWVIGLSQSESLGNRTNNRVESLNQKIKQVIDRNAKFDAFAVDLVNFLHMHRTEINGKICKTVNKVPTKGASGETADGMYRRLCTEYAYKLVEKQIQKSQSVQVTETWDAFSCSSGDDEYSVTETSCTCEFHKQYRLPCKHILAVRTRKNLNLFSEDLIDCRWTKAKYLGILNQTATEYEVQTVGTSPARKPTSQQDRFRKSFRIAQRIASVAAEYTGTIFEVKINQLQEMLSAWENGKNIVISTVDNNNIEPQADCENQIEVSPVVASEPSYSGDEEPASANTDIEQVDALPMEISATDTTDAVLRAETANEEEEQDYGDVTENHQTFEQDPIAPADDSGNVLLDQAANTETPDADTFNLEQQTSPLRPPSSVEDDDSDNDVQITRPPHLRSKPRRSLSLTKRRSQCTPLEEQPESTVSATTVSTTEMHEHDDAVKVPEAHQKQTHEGNENEDLVSPVDANNAEEIAVEQLLQLAVGNTIPPTNDNVSETEIESSTSGESQHTISTISGISLPPKIPKRGRPKGSELTVIGIPRKRMKLQKNKLVPFEHMTEQQQHSFVLAWLVDRNVINRCMTEQYAIQEADVEVNPACISLACKEIDVSLVKQYFSEDAWLLAKQATDLRMANEWTCDVCSEELETRAIACDRCLLWFHYHCASISAKPRTKFWYCLQCRSAALM